MSRIPISRRQFLTLPLGLLLVPWDRGHAALQSRRATYVVDVGILYDSLTFHLAGTIEESVDRERGRYDVKLAGQGAGIANRVEASGILLAGRWAPVRASSWFSVRGRQSRSEVSYDHERRVIEYHYRGETFFLRRARAADDIVPIPEAQHVDDVISATLNYADELWPPREDGSLQTQVVRRKRQEGEGPDDADKVYRAELVPFVLSVAREADTGQPVALFDLTRFSSWARESRPARIVFGPDRRPQLITSSLILGTSLTIRLQDA